LLVLDLGLQNCAIAFEHITFKTRHQWDEHDYQEVFFVVSSIDYTVFQRLSNRVFDYTS
jgi:hypothetical protein